MPALETLAVIAYKQPAPGPEIQEIRGVNCAGVLKTLLEKRLIVTAGRKEVIGRPILYRTSRDFLMRFGLSDVDELPSLKEFEALAREALGADEGIAPMVPEVPSQAESAPAPGAPQEAPSSAEAGGSDGKAAAAPANPETAGGGRGRPRPSQKSQPRPAPNNLSPAGPRPPPPAPRRPPPAHRP